MSFALRRSKTRLPPNATRALLVRNLPLNITSEEMYDMFGKFGAIRQIRVGASKNTRGSAFVVYEDIYDAKAALDHLTGFDVASRYLIVLYYQTNRKSKKMTVDDFRKEEEKLNKLRENYGVSTKADK